MRDEPTERAWTPGPWEVVDRDGIYVVGGRFGNLINCYYEIADTWRVRADADRAARVERDRIVAIIEANVPHDGYCSMDDCTGCEIVDRLKRLIERDEHEEAQ